MMKIAVPVTERGMKTPGPDLECIIDFALDPEALNIQFEPIIFRFEHIFNKCPGVLIDLMGYVEIHLPERETVACIIGGTGSELNVTEGPEFDCVCRPCHHRA